MSDDDLDAIVVAASRVEDMTVAAAARSPTGAHFLPDRRESDRDRRLDEFGDDSWTD